MEVALYQTMWVDGMDATTSNKAQQRLTWMTVDIGLGNLASTTQGCTALLHTTSLAPAHSTQMHTRALSLVCVCVCDTLPWQGWAVGIWFMGNMAQGALTQTNAFEIYANGELVSGQCCCVRGGGKGVTPGWKGQETTQPPVINMWGCYVGLCHGVAILPVDIWRPPALATSSPCCITCLCVICAGLLQAPDRAPAQLQRAVHWLGPHRAP